MLTTTAGGRVWNFSHAIGRNAAAGAGFTQPMAVAAAPGGVLYVVSRGQERSGGVIMENKRLSKVTIDEEFIGEFGRTEFAWPAAIAVASDGSVYCADEAENLIAMYNSDGERLGQWGESGTEEGLLDGPCGLAFDSDDNVYVVECRNDRVQRFSKDGKFQAAWGGAGSGEGQFNHPWGITIDVKGDVYVADWRNNRVQKFTADGEFIMSFGPSEDEALKLDHPAGVAVDSDGDVYVTDWGNKRVKIFDPEGGVLASLRRRRPGVLQVGQGGRGVEPRRGKGLSPCEGPDAAGPVRETRRDSGRRKRPDNCYRQQPGQTPGLRQREGLPGPPVQPLAQSQAGHTPGGILVCHGVACS